MVLFRDVYHPDGTHESVQVPANEEAAIRAEWAQNQISEQSRRDREQRDDTDRAAVTADTFVQTFVNMTVPEVEAYVDNNTANLAATRALLKKMAIMLLILARKA